MKKTLKISLVILAALAVAAVLSLGIFYLYAEAVIFDHRDCSVTMSSVDPAEAEGYSINYPFFTNPVGIDNAAGRIYFLGFIVGNDNKNLNVYEAVNAPIYLWVDYLYGKYGGHINLDYTLEQDKKNISVNMSGNLNDGKNDVPIEQKFVFDIENAAPDNLPRWINENEISEGYREYLNFVTNPGDTVAPDWYAR